MSGSGVDVVLDMVAAKNEDSELTSECSPPSELLR